MPSLNLRNPFRRDSVRPPRRQPAASLKAAAARVIRGEPSPLDAASPALAALDAEFQAAVAALEKADHALVEVQGPFEDPAMPAALRPQCRDMCLNGIPRPDMMPLANGKLRALPYGRAQVEELRKRDRMLREHGFGAWLSSPEAQARGSEIVAAWDAWQAEVEAAKQAAGIPQRFTAWSAALDHRNEVLARIHEVPARSLADFVIKARVASAVCQGESLRPEYRGLSIEGDDAMPYAIAAELLALSIEPRTIRA